MTSRAGCALYNRGTAVMGATSCFPVGFKALQEGACIYRQISLAEKLLLFPGTGVRRCQAAFYTSVFLPLLTLPREALTEWAAVPVRVKRTIAVL